MNPTDEIRHEIQTHEEYIEFAETILNSDHKHIIDRFKSIFDYDQITMRSTTALIQLTEKLSTESDRNQLHANNEIHKRIR